MKKEEAKWQKVLWVVCMLLFSVAATAVAAYFYGNSLRNICLLLIVVTAGYAGVAFALVQSDICGVLHYDNGGHYVRFVLTFMIGIAASCLLPLLPDSGWAFPAIALALTLFANTATGLMAYAVILGICIYFSDSSVLIFLMYFLIGCLYAILFERLDEDYKTGEPICIATMVYSVIMIARIIFRSYGALEIEMFMIPVINLFITFLLVLAVLRFYCAVVIDREKGRFLEINDQEFQLLAKYKDENRDVYYNAIHTAYFAEKAARLFHMDVDVAKNGGYYHKIIAAECKKEDKSLEEICRKYKFPPKAVRLLQEYNYKSEPIIMKETAVVYLADSVVSSIMYLLDKDDNKEVDFAQIAIAVMKRKIDSGILNKSDISISELCGMEKIFTGEKLYYDFLRRK